MGKAGIKLKIAQIRFKEATVKKKIDKMGLLTEINDNP
jgi:hypothetical protein